MVEHSLYYMNKIWKTIVNPVTNNLIKVRRYFGIFKKEELDEYSYYVMLIWNLNKSLRKLNYIKSKLIGAIVPLDPKYQSWIHQLRI